MLTSQLHSAQLTLVPANYKGGLVDARQLLNLFCSAQFKINFLVSYFIKQPSLRSLSKLSFWREPRGQRVEREKPAIHNLLAGNNFLSLLKPVHRIFKKANLILFIDHKRSFVHPCLPLMTEFHGPDIPHRFLQLSPWVVTAAQNKFRSLVLLFILHSYQRLFACLLIVITFNMDTFLKKASCWNCCLWSR